MFEFINFKEEAIALTKWLISIPSITSTHGEMEISKAIYDTVCGISYFRTHRNDVLYVPHSDQKHHSVVALVKIDGGITRETLCVLCSSDTSGNDSYAMLKPLSFKPDELKEKLRGIIKKSDKAQALSYSNTLYGLGSFESKGVTGALLTLVKEASDRLYELPFNLLFVCTSQTISGNTGIRECMPYIHSLLSENHLDLKLTVAFKPENRSNDENNLNLYTANMGRSELCFYILGKGADSAEPFKGFSPTQVCSRIIEKMELNPKVTSRLSKRPFVPVFRSMLMPPMLSPRTLDSALVSFELPFLNLNLLDLIEVLKSLAAEALEESCTAIENRENDLLTMLDQEYLPEVRDAEVLSYSDLFYRASRHYRGDLQAAIDGLLNRCAKKEYTREETVQAVIERLNDLARLPRPSVVICLGSNFIPQQQIRQNNSGDREVYRRISDAVDSFNSDFVQQIKFAGETSASDCCFIRPVGVDQAVKALRAECPIPFRDFYNLGAPAVTLTVKGEDLYLPTEHVSTEIFDIIPGFLSKLFDVFKQEDDLKGEEEPKDDEDEVESEALPEGADEDSDEQPSEKK